VKSRPARVARALVLVASALSIVGWVAGVTRHWWATTQPDFSRPYSVRFRGSELLYVPAPVGWWLDNGLRVTFAVLGFAVWADLFDKRSAR
jgi:hypothetical protein